MTSRELDTRATLETNGETADHGAVDVSMSAPTRPGLRDRFLRSPIVQNRAVQLFVVVGVAAAVAAGCGGTNNTQSIREYFEAANEAGTLSDKGKKYRLIYYECIGLDLDKQRIRASNDPQDEPIVSQEEQDAIEGRKDFENIHHRCQSKAFNEVPPSIRP